ncbi:MAG: ABC transporter permease [Verrucomicrobiales bacterium]|jgi:NitT/TauT family transport system permease protein|nr:ABC transporter permease [Verrucomicrobiales bacterium]
MNANPVILNAAPLLAAGGALAVHRYWPDAVPLSLSPAFPWLLGAAAAAWLVWLAAAIFSARLRRRAADLAPLFAAALVGVSVWQILTGKTGLLPMPFFPGPDRVFAVFGATGEIGLLVVGTLHSLRLLAVGFLCGSGAGFLLGVWIGWNRRAHYWGMPVLKFFGPIPATAWIPLALVLFPTTFGASAFIIGLASLFPMIVLTASGIASARHSHLEVARTLGASQRQLICHVAIPSALPSIFVGLFMALSASFLTLIVAEMIGVKAGLGFYITWAQNFAEYYKVFAALLVMGVFFSGLMSALFAVRARVLRWQQGVIKW